MTGDLSKRLREYTSGDNDAIALCDEAADAIDRLTAERDAAWHAGATAMQERCAGIGDVMINEFMSPEYATGQPLSSFGERFACKQMSERCRALSPSTLNKPE